MEQPESEQQSEQSEQSEASIEEQPESEQPERVEQLLPDLEQLTWKKLAPGAANAPLAISRELFDAIKAAGGIIIRSEDEAQDFEDSLMDTNSSIKREEKRAEKKKRAMAWHKTKYTAEQLVRRDGFQRYSKPTICCIRHGAIGGANTWYEVQFVYVPLSAFESAALNAEASALNAAANVRFETNVEGSRPVCKLKKPKSIRGEATIKERGGKSIGGAMLMYGAHRRSSAGAAEEVPGCAHEWPDRYNPSGKASDASNAAMQRVEAHARALQAVEEALLPQAAQVRRLLAEKHDSAANFRVVNGDTGCTGFSLSLTHGYVVAPHDDSGSALEAIGFSYPSKTPLPEGHKWEFVVAGSILLLPTKPDEFAFIAVQGSGVAHGTLPTSSTESHCANHPGVGSALVSKKSLVDVLTKQSQPGAPPAPTEEQLALQRKKVNVIKTFVDFDKAKEATTALQWKDALRLKLANDEIPITAVDGAPKSVCKALDAFTEKHGEGCIILATTPSTYSALGVPSVNDRAAAGWMLQELLRRVSDQEKSVHPNLVSPGGSTKHTWFILTPAGRAELAAAARDSTVSKLDSAVRMRSEATIRKQAMEKLAAQGLHECPECLGPVLDPNDPQYADKDALIQQIGKHGTVLKQCECKGGVCFPDPPEPKRHRTEAPAERSSLDD